MPSARVIVAATVVTAAAGAAFVAYRRRATDAGRIDLGELVSKYVAETEQRLGSVFGVADDADTVLYLDDADDLFDRDDAEDPNADRD